MQVSKQLQDRIDKYLEDVSQHMGDIPPEEKSDTLQYLKDHIEDSLRKKDVRDPSISDLEAVLEDMDPPQSYESGTVSGQKYYLRNAGVVLLGIAIVVVGVLVYQAAHRPHVKAGPSPVYTLPAELTNSLVLRYSFDVDEGYKVSDMSGCGNHGSVHGAKWMSLTNGGAYNFEGYNYIETPNNASLSITKQITISSWVLLRSLPTYGSWPALVEKRSGVAGSGYAMLQCSEASTVEMSLPGLKSAIAKNGTDRAAEAAITKKPIPLNTWAHVTGTYNGNMVRIYVNGVLDSTTENASGDIVECASSLFIGRRSYEPVFLDGALDEVMIFNRALSDAEVKKLYDACR